MRRKRKRPPVPSTDQLIEEWVSSLTDVEGFSPAEAEEYRAVILDFQRRLGISDFRTVTKRDIERACSPLISSRGGEPAPYGSVGLLVTGSLVWLPLIERCPG